MTALLSLLLQAFLSEGWVTVKPSARQFMPITSVQVFSWWPWPWPAVGLSFWTSSRQSLLSSTWSCHLSRRVRSSFARSLSCIFSIRSCELTWSLVVTLHIQWIIARSLRCKCSKPGLWPGLLVGGRAILQANWQPAGLTGAHSRM